MLKPQYKGNSIVNLTSTLLQHYGIKSDYPPLNCLSKKVLSDTKTIILFIIDGLGADFLQQNGRGSFFLRHKIATISSVFPTTTASAMLTYYTGKAPTEHGIPAWFTYLREVGMIARILPFTPRNKEISLTEFGVNPRDIYTFESLFDKLLIKQHIFTPQDLIGMPLGNLIDHNRVEHGFSDLEDLFDQVGDLVSQAQNNPEPKFIFVYWPQLDALEHEHGITHKTTIQHFQELDRMCEENITAWKTMDPNLKVLISADHGLIDIPPENQFELDAFPVLKQCLTLPLAGEGRVPFFYIHPDSETAFKQEIQAHFGKLGKLYTQKEVFEKNLLGLQKPIKSLPSRIGDYIFIFNTPYLLKDAIPGEKRHEMIGHHGGLSEEELFVPLLLF